VHFSTAVAGFCSIQREHVQGAELAACAEVEAGLGVEGERTKVNEINGFAKAAFFAAVDGAAGALITSNRYLGKSPADFPRAFR
jgi:hypothetical protein